MNVKPLATRAFQSTFAGSILFLVSFVQSIAVVPILLRYWGEEKYGLWIAIWAFVLLMRTFDLGHLNLVGNEFLKLFHIDKVAARSTLASAVKVSLLLGVAEMLVYILLMLTGLVEDLIGIPKNVEGNVELGVLVALLPWTLAGGAISVVLRAIPAFGKYTEMLYASIVIKLAELLVFIWCGLTNKSIFEVCIWISIVNCLYVFGIFVYLKKLTFGFYPWWKGGSLAFGIKNFTRSLALTFNAVFEQYLNNGIIVLISKSMSLLFVPAFTTVRTLTNTAVQATSIIVDPLTPDLIRFYAAKDFSKIRQVFMTNWFITSLVINVPFIVLIPFLELLYHIWTAHQLQFEQYLFYFLALSVSLANFGRPFVLIIRTLNMLSALNIITAVRLIIVFGLSLPLIENYGLSAIGFAIFVSEIFCSIIIPIYFFNRQVFSFSSVLLMKGLYPVVLLGSFSISISVFPDFKYEICGLFLIAQILLSVYAWQQLSDEVRSRLKKLIPRFT